MIKLVGLSGSLRKKSFNTGLLRAAEGRMPEGSSLLVRTIHGIPLYDADSEEAHGIPAAVVELKEDIARADGLVIATPEYNNSIPGPLKNAIDWLTRPPADIQRVFRGKPIALIGATPGNFGTILGQNEWLPVLRYLGTSPWFEGRLMISQADKVFDEHGQVKDEETLRKIDGFFKGFVRFIDRKAGG